MIPKLRWSLINSLINQKKFQPFFFLLFTFPVIFLACFNYVRTYRFITDSIISQRKSLAFLASTIVDAKMDGLVDISISFATRPRLVENLAAGNWAAALDVLKDSSSTFPNIERVFLTDINGFAMADSLLDGSIIGKSGSNRDWYKGVSRAWQPYVSGVYERDTGPRHAVVSLAIPVRRSGSLNFDNLSPVEKKKNLLGILVLQLDINIFSEWANRIDVGPGGLVYIVDQYGHVVFHPKFSDRKDIIDFSGVSIVKKLMKGHNGAEINYNPVEKEERFAAYQTIPDYGWGIVVTQPVKMVFAQRREALGYGIFVYFVMVLLSYWLAKIILFSIDSQKKSEEALRKSAAWFSTTLKSIGDGVIVTDNQARVIFLNPIAQILTGWKEDEAKGLPLKKIFHIINEETGQEVESPVDRVIREGVIVGLGNHTILVTKDGIRRPIDDSAAPIRDDIGNFVGVVLVFRDVTERRAAEKRVQEALKVKSHFTSTVSHELRTPLAAIKEGIAIVLDRSAGTINEKQEQFLELAKRNVDRLSRLINDVLDFQKLESGKAAFNIAENDINGLVHEAWESMQVLAKAKGLECTLSLEENLPVLKFDHDKITQVLINFLNNAIKFTEKGSIMITTSHGDNFVRVSVQDSGPGINDEDLSRLFQQFIQLGLPSERKTGSTGLGLAISKEIIEAHKGKIWAESKLGQGSVFSFALPVHERRAQRA